MKHSKLILLALLATSCGVGFIAKSDSKAFFVLRDDKTAIEEVYGRYPLKIIVRTTEAPRFVNSKRIIFSTESSSRGYYQYAMWMEPPPKRFMLLLRQRLERSKLFDIVTTRSSATVGDLQLNTELLEFFHDVEEPPGQVKVLVKAELINLEKHDVLASKEFEKTAEVRTYDIDGAVEGFNGAVTKVLDEMVLWLDESL